jgi:hypothetical protein
MALHGITVYGTDTYGYDIPPQYRVDPFIAQSIDYKSVMLSWVQPGGDILAWRLVKNYYGPPTDQDDGEILIDTTTGYPGSSFVDTSVIPGVFHYYGFYVLIDFLGNEWVRSGTTACLAIKNYDSQDYFLNLVPSFFQNAGGSGEEFTVDDSGDIFLNQFMGVFGWGFDYLRTQYDTYLNVNNPWTIPPADLYNLALELGIDINPDIHPYTLRKAVYFNAVVNQQRGTQTGIDTELSALTGYAGDITIGRNMMLENDQSYFPDPSFEVWSSGITYAVNEIVSFGNFFYKCLSTANLGNAPTGANTSNTWWQPYTNQVDTTTLANTVTGGINTWETITPSASNGISANSIAEIDGVTNPLVTTVNTYNAIQAKNTTGSTTAIWLRSVARTIKDITAGSAAPFTPGKTHAIADGIPVPYLLPTQDWNTETRYGTTDIVDFSNIPYIARRASTNTPPPYSVIGGSSNSWAPISPDQRYRIMVSGYLSGSAAVAATPFVDWFDAQGNYITRVVARSPGTSAGIPDQFAYDSFSSGAETTLGSRTTDDGSTTWSQNVGTFQLSPFDNGCVYPQTTGARAYATVMAGNANTNVGLTFVTSANTGQSHGLLLRFLNDSNYLRAGRTSLKLNTAGTLSTLGTYSTPFSDGDRMVVQLNGSSIIVLRNGVSVLSVTNGFNTSGTTHGIINENT